MTDTSFFKKCLPRTRSAGIVITLLLTTLWTILPVGKAAGESLTSRQQNILSPLWPLLLPGETDYSRCPFASTSVWKTAIGIEATYQDIDDPEPTLLRRSDLGYPWILEDAFGVYQASESDPERTWSYAARPGEAYWPFGTKITNGTFTMPTPDEVEFLGTTDRHAVIILPDKKSAVEIWHGAYDTSTETYSADFIAYMDLTGSGISSTDGLQLSVRAYGGALLGGIILKEELDSGKINHPVAMAIDPDQLQEGEIMAGYTTRRDMSTQKVWPASTTDGLGWNSYAGLIPMGSLWALPPDTDLDSLGLTTSEGMALARAYKYYGGYVIDQAFYTTCIAALEANCTSEQVTHLQTDKWVILNHLVMITNNSEEHPGGPGDRLIESQDSSGER